MQWQRGFSNTMKNRNQRNLATYHTRCVLEFLKLNESKVG